MVPLKTVFCPLCRNSFESYVTDIMCPRCDGPTQEINFGVRKRSEKPSARVYSFEKYHRRKRQLPDSNPAF